MIYFVCRIFLHGVTEKKIEESGQIAKIENTLSIFIPMSKI